jgi:endoglucanase
MNRQALIAALITASAVQAQQGAWAQCGGQGFTGATTCISGYVCTYSNPWYSQCIPGTQTMTTTTRATTTSSTTTSSTSTGPTGSGGKLKWVGVDESGAEWGTTFPGTEGVDYFFPSTTTINVSETLAHSWFALNGGSEKDWVDN